MIARLLLTALSLVMLASCQEAGPKSGSETHWVPICSSNQDCTVPLECICGDCRLPCETQSQCEGQDPVTICASEEVLDDNCLFLPDGITSACFPPCTEAANCTAFGEGLQCLDSVCIPPKE